MSGIRKVKEEFEVPTDWPKRESFAVRKLNRKSLGAVMLDDTGQEGQSKRRNEMYRQLYDSGKLSDIALDVGSLETKVFHVHKLILSMSSSVFKNWFDNLEFEPDRPIKIRNVEPKEFDQLMRFIYTGELQAETMTNVLEIVKVTKRFDIHDLLDACMIYIEENLCMRNVWMVYELALTEGHQKMRALAKKLFLDECTFVFDLFECYKCKPEPFEAIVKDVAADMDAISLFNGVQTWAKSQRSSLKEGQTFRKIMFPFLKYIRFLEMSVEVFKKSVGPSGALTDEEFTTILSHLSGAPTNLLPPWCVFCLLDPSVSQTNYKSSGSFQLPLESNHDSKDRSGVTLCCRFKVVEGRITVNGVAAQLKMLFGKNIVDINKAQVWFFNENPLLHEAFNPRVERNGDLTIFMFSSPLSLRKGEERTIQILLPALSNEDCKYIFEKGCYQEKAIVVNQAHPCVIVRALTPNKKEKYGLLNRVFYEPILPNALLRQK